MIVGRRSFSGSKSWLKAALCISALLCFSHSGHTATWSLKAALSLENALGQNHQIDATEIARIKALSDTFWNANRNDYLIPSFYFHDLNKLSPRPAGSYYLSLNYPNIDKLQLLKISRDGAITVEILGDEMPFHGRRVSYRLPTFELELPKDHLIIIQGLDTVASNLTVRLYAKDDFDKHIQADYLFYGMYFGILVFLIAGSLILLFFTKESSFFWYASYLSSAIIFLLVSNGLGQAVVWPYEASTTKFSFWGGSGMAISITLFAHRFLGLERRRRYFYTSSYVVLSLIGITAISLFFVHHGAVDKAFFVLAGYQMIAVFWQAVKSHIRGNDVALYLVLGYLVLFPALGMSILKFLGLIAPTDLANRSVELSFLVEALIFSFGLGKKLQHLTTAKFDAERKMQAHRSRYLNRLIEARESEKRDIGVVLHNSVAQTLALSKSKLIQLGKVSNQDKVIEIAGLVDQAMQRVRDISHSTYPHILDQLGLAPAVTQYAQTHLDPQEVDWKCKLHRIELNERENLLLYRILQECINNVVRHANASMVLINLSIDNAKGRRSLSIHDDGVGFDTTASGFGLATINEYAEALGGDFQVTSSTSGGTTITINF